MSRNKADLISGLTRPRSPIEDTNAHTSEPSNVQMNMQTNIPPIVYTEERKRRYSFDLPDSLHLQLKIHAASQRKTMSDIVEEALRQYLK